LAHTVVGVRSRMERARVSASSLDLSSILSKEREREEISDTISFRTLLALGVCIKDTLERRILNEGDVLDL
jgi:hypothetical protein